MFFNVTTDKNRFSEGTNTCSDKHFNNSIQGFFGQFQDAYFYANVIQFVIVALMYINVGSGKYWKILFYASLAGFLGGLLENLTIGFICQGDYDPNVHNNPVITFLIDEVFWTLCEYSIPYLNLIKMKAFSQGKVANSIKYTIYILFIPFAIFRLLIGYHRMRKGYLIDEDIQALHGYAFGIMAISDILCTIFILYYVRKHNTQETLKGSSIHNFIKKSSYTILVTVDIVSILLSIFHIIFSSGLFIDRNNTNTVIETSESVTVPFHCLKSNFILILATDAVLFKYSANTSSSLKGSTESKSKFHIGNENSVSYNNKDNNAYKSFQQNYSVDMSNSTNISNYKKDQNYNVISYSTNYNYPSTKSIVKNYTNSNSTLIRKVNNENNINSPIEIDTYFPQQFGFLKYQNEF